MRPAALFPLFLLFSLASVHALFPDPPFSNVTEHNLILAPSLNDSYSPATGVNGTIGMDFNGTDINWAYISRHFDFSIIHASAKLLAMEPSVDNATSASASPKLLFTWGALADPLASDDYEHDDCNESQISSSISRSAAINFSFRNESEVVIVTDANVVPVPARILEAMEGTIGNDTLAVELNATFVFRYDMNDRKAIVEGGCSDRQKTFFSSISVTDYRNWSVEGNRTLFFLRSPVLGEQWYLNNRFDSIVLSNSRLYKARVIGPGNQSGDFRLYAFDVTNDTYDVWSVVSMPLDSHDGAAGQAAQNTPTPLDPDNFTYAYAYEFNYSYAGLGENTLTLEAVPLFGNSYSFSRTLLSRMLTHSGNTTELGGAADSSVSRPSVPFSADSLRTVTLSLGLVGLLLAVLLLNRLFKK